MNFSITAQLVSIVFKVVVMGFIALRFHGMEYSFWNIVMRLLIHRDTRPIQWLMEHIVFLYYLVFIVAQFISFLGLVHQLRMDRLLERMPEFVISSPLSSIMLTLIFLEHFKLLDGIREYTHSTFKALIKNKQKIKNH